VTAYARLLAELSNRGLTVTESEPGKQAMAQCPAHADDRASLSITNRDDRAFVKCHAGCKDTDALAAIGWTVPQLFDNGRGATYTYADGRVVYRTYEGNQKQIQSPGSLKAGTVLYRLDRVQQAVADKTPIWLVEGEEDVHTLEHLGYVATTAPGGAANVGYCDFSPLRGASRLLALPDQDKSGLESWSPKVAAKLAELGQPAEWWRPADGCKDASEHFAAGYRGGDFVQMAPPVAAEADARYDDWKRQTIDADGLRNIPAPDPLVGDWLFCDSTVWLTGKPGHGKTFVAVDLAGCVATGQAWHGHIVKQGPVFYVIAEGARGLSLRVDAWSREHGVKPAGVSFLPVAVQLLDPGHLPAFTRLVTELRPVLVIIDTQARTTVGHDENSPRDMGMLVAAIEQVREVTGACVLMVHHEPRAGENPRGHSSIDGAATTIIRAEKDGAIITIENTKQRDAVPAPTMKLALRPVGESAALTRDFLAVAAVMTDSEHKLIAALEHLDGDASRTQLQDVAGLGKSTFYTVVAVLVVRGLIEKYDEGRSKRYRLPGNLSAPNVGNATKDLSKKSLDSDHGQNRTSNKSDTSPTPETWSDLQESDVSNESKPDRPTSPMSTTPIGGGTGSDQDSGQGDRGVLNGSPVAPVMDRVDWSSLTPDQRKLAEQIAGLSATDDGAG
jgi:hypothetical protein